MDLGKKKFSDLIYYEKKIDQLNGMQLLKLRPFYPILFPSLIAKLGWMVIKYKYFFIGNFKLSASKYNYCKYMKSLPNKIIIEY